MIGLEETIDDKAYSLYCDSVMKICGFSTTVTKYWFKRNYNDYNTYQEYYNIVINNERRNKIEKIKYEIYGLHKS